MASRRMTDEDYEKLDKFLQLPDEQFYAVVTTKLRNKWVRSVHVFARHPTPKELTEYERTVSQLRFKGNRTEMEGSQLTAARHLYDLLIDRAYDVPFNNRYVKGELTEDGKGNITGDGLTREAARAYVSPMIKRAALRDALGEHYSEAQVAEQDGDDEVKGKEDD